MEGTSQHCAALCMQGNVLVCLFGMNVFSVLPVCVFCELLPDSLVHHLRAALRFNSKLCCFNCTRYPGGAGTPSLPSGVILYLWNEAATLCVSSNLRCDGKSPFIEAKRALQTDLIQPRRWCTFTKNWQIGFLVTSHLWAPCSWHYLIWVRKRGLRGPR